MHLSNGVMIQNSKQRVLLEHMCGTESRSQILRIYCGIWNGGDGGAVEEEQFLVPPTKRSTDEVIMGGRWGISESALSSSSSCPL